MITREQILCHIYGIHIKPTFSLSILVNNSTSAASDKLSYNALLSIKTTTLNEIFPHICRKRANPIVHKITLKYRHELKY